MKREKKMIRVLRLIEYVYPDAETMEEDMACWYVGPIGSKRIGIGKTKVIRSTVLTDLQFEVAEEIDHVDDHDFKIGDL
jgi:hypothetical protein